uniref:Uncharacterized protein n=1 Tax=Panagrolaimus sp. PS1159 TaxID=55785 RepID=A0AC35FLA7_9BILA
MVYKLSSNNRPYSLLTNTGGKEGRLIKSYSTLNVTRCANDRPYWHACPPTYGFTNILNTYPTPYQTSNFFRPGQSAPTSYYGSRIQAYAAPLFYRRKYYNYRY